MTTFLAWLKLIPALLSFVIQAAHAIEEAFAAVATATGNTAAGTGSAKIALFESTVTELSSNITGLGLDSGLVVSLAKRLVGYVVAAFNALGWFKHGS